jgi:uncharacterized protein YjbJ (UPF0337 family)
MKLISAAASQGIEAVSSMPEEAILMGLGDKAKDKAESAKGKTKERVGGATGDRSMEAEGKADKSKGDIKQAGEKVKDAFKS